MLIWAEVVIKENMEELWRWTSVQISIQRSIREKNVLGRRKQQNKSEEITKMSMENVRMKRTNPKSVHRAGQVLLTTGVTRQEACEKQEVTPK